MLLSIIIVNYNVKYFLEQCLCSVKKALEQEMLLQRGEAEVMVIDNHSTDGSLEYLQPRFPFVKFIPNSTNAGYGRANNQGLQQAEGKYVLFLNPDTVLPEDIFQKTLAFLDKHARAGALGVRMLDGSGRFLRESKRGLPTPWASFCKMAGLTGLFPSSRSFAQYYMGHLDEKKTQEVEVLAGAFLMAPRHLLLSLGGFDERFFMYAEDIDLSYRIMQAGYKNYYFADAEIIHFKGESTRKDARYVQLFYKAMRQFVQKHHRSGGGKVSSVLLSIAIRLRSGLAMVTRRTNAQPVRLLGAVALKGDPAASNEIRKWLSAHNLISQSPDAATFYIFCEGAAYSFKDIIKAISGMDRRRKALIHASESDSIVGSFDKNGQGVTIGMS